MVIIAPTTVGKSTTIFGLCLRDCEYLSDDIVIYEFSEHAIYPYPLPIAMRDVSLFNPSEIDEKYYTFPWETENPTKNGGDKKKLYFPKFNNQINYPWSIGAIYVLDRDKNHDSCCITQLSAQEAFITIYKNCSNPFTMTNNNCLALELAKSCNVWKVKYGNGLKYLDHMVRHFANFL